MAVITLAFEDDQEPQEPKGKKRWGPVLESVSCISPRKKEQPKDALIAKRLWLWGKRVRIDIYYGKEASREPNSGEPYLLLLPDKFEVYPLSEGLKNQLEESGAMERIELWVVYLYNQWLRNGMEVLLDVVNVNIEPVDIPASATVPQSARMDWKDGNWEEGKVVAEVTIAPKPIKKATYEKRDPKGNTDGEGGACVMFLEKKKASEGSSWLESDKHPVLGGCTMEQSSFPTGATKTTFDAGEWVITVMYNPEMKVGSPEMDALTDGKPYLALSQEAIAFSDKHLPEDSELQQRWKTYVRALLSLWEIKAKRAEVIDKMKKYGVPYPCELNITEKGLHVQEVVQMELRP